MVPDEELLTTVLELKPVPVVCLWLAEEDGSKLRSGGGAAIARARSLLVFLASNDDGLGAKRHTGLGAERDTRHRSLLLDGESEV